MLAGRFEQIDGSQRLDFEVRERDLLGFIVGRLRSAVNDQIEAVLPEKVKDPSAVADIKVVVKEASGTAPQAVQVPGGVSRRTKEFATHVVVDTEDAMTASVEVLNGLRTD